MLVRVKAFRPGRQWLWARRLGFRLSKAAPRPVGAPASPLPPHFVHDLNNPLNTLGSLLCLLESDPTLSEQARRYLELGRMELRRLHGIVLAAAKPEAASARKKAA